MPLLRLLKEPFEFYAKPENIECII